MSHKFKLIIITGTACSGKSMLAAELSKLLNAEYISTDLIRRRLYGKSSTFSKDETQNVFNSLIDYIRNNNTTTETLICEGFFYAIERRVALYNIMPNETIIINLVAGFKTIKERWYNRTFNYPKTHQLDVHMTLDQLELNYKKTSEAIVEDQFVINTDNLTPQNVVNRAVYLINTATSNKSIIKKSLLHDQI